jgi:hypothetical protein
MSCTEHSSMLTWTTTFCLSPGVLQSACSDTQRNWQRVWDLFQVWEPVAAPPSSRDCVRGLRPLS